jgi:type I restriction enzyme S subunit
MKFGLEQLIIDKLIAVFEQYSKVDKAFVFGSRAKGNYRPDSDIDIAIKGHGLNTDDIIAMCVAFEEKGITHKIDLINYQSIKEPDLKEHIDRVGIDFYSRWKIYKFGDIAQIIGGGTPSTSNPNNWNGDIPWLTPRDLTGYTNVYISKGERNITNEGLTNSSARMLPKGSVLLTSRAPIGYVVIASNEICTNQGFKNLILNETIAHNLFIYYWLKNNVEYLQSIGTGTTFAEISASTVKDVDIELPPLSEQKEIASVLNSIDLKIELLQSQNKTLEQLAETLFRSYFPMTNEENKYVELGNYVECINGVSYKSSELNSSKVGMVSLKSFDRNGGFSIEGFKEFTGKYKEKQIVVEGDLIVAHTDITQDAEVIGNPALVISNPNFDTMTISMDIVKVISKVDWISIEFLYFLMRTREFKSHCEGCANGSTVLHLNKQAIPTFEFPEPDKTKVAAFTKQAKEIVNKIFLNHRQLRNLVRTRDTLLPKLMSGEVRVSLN